MTIPMRIQHELNSNKVDQISVTGVNGDNIIISGPGAGEDGVVLAPHSTGLFDMPIKTNWSDSIFGSSYQSWKPQRREIVWTAYIFNPDTLQGYEDDPDTWSWIYTRWRNMFSPKDEATINYTSPDGDRTLGCRTIQTSKSVSSLSFEGHDPKLWPFGSVVQTMGCEIPFYQGLTETFEWEWAGAGSTYFTLPYFNPGDVEIWPNWELSANAKWFLPDYSFGCEEYGRGQADLGKTVEFPLLIDGEDIQVDSRPDIETIIAANDAPVGLRMGGRDLEYPIQPGMGDPIAGCTVRVTNVTDGAALRLHLPRWYSDPFGTPRIAA